MKKNKIIFIIVSIIIFILGAIYIITLINQSNKTIEKKVIIEKIEYSLEEAISSMEILNCSKLIEKDIGKKVLCENIINNQLALKNNDYKYCDLINDKKIRLNCILDLNKYFFDNAIKTYNHELCIMIPNYKKKEECINIIDNYYFKNNDCKNIFDSEYKAQCENQKDTTIFLEVRKSGNSNQCNQLTDEKLKNECMKTIDNDLFIDAYDIEGCNNIVDKDLKLKCVKKINFESGNYDKGSKAFCNSLDTEEMQNKCYDSYYLHQIESGNSKLELNCSKIKNIEIQNYCKSILKKNIEKEAIQKEIKELEKKGDDIGVIELQCKSNNIGTAVENCKRKEITKKAILDNDLSICDSLINDKQKNICKIDTQFELDSKLFKKAISENNIDLCNDLSTQEKQETCKKYFN